MRTLCVGWALGAATAGSFFLVVSQSALMSGPDFAGAQSEQPSSNSVPASSAPSAETAGLSEEALIDELFAKYDCHQVFFDVGANIGQQTRKVFQAEEFKNSPDMKDFDEYLGQPPRCSVCAIGIEPNPRHKHRLDALTERLTGAGAGVLFLHAVAAVMDAPVKFDTLPDKKNLDWGAKVGFASDLHQQRNETHEFVMLPGLDLSRLIHYIDGKLRDVAARKKLPARGSILMKLDVEFSELVLVPLMFMTGAICKITAIQFEDHSKLLKMDRDWRKGYVSAEMDNFRKWVDSCPQARKPVLIENDDEKAKRALQPWPKGPICQRPPG